MAATTTTIKAFYFLIAILHGGPHAPFAITRLGEYEAMDACDKAAKAMTSALDGAVRTARAQFTCVGSGAIGALIPRS